MLMRRRFSSGAVTALFASTYASPMTVAAVASSNFPTVPSVSVGSSSFSLQHCVLQRRFNADAASASSGGASTALDVAMRVNKLKRMHQSGQGQGKKEVERMAWRELNTLSEQQIATAEGKAVALLLNAWAYFARYWEKGKDGPYESNSASTGDDEQK